MSGTTTTVILKYHWMINISPYLEPLNRNGTPGNSGVR